eukprot:CAMPEP_0172360622 /NCGR_PEP_ID=MMETSP1060-20121228/4612_1 /TAXON_ID=37318 /ORGANISM="Pseudo-nitzschia pungens, Strain cf. cingulata" /LENGTH=420 /DNA_ID=CAMNT_0013082663 /DNA_START=235 /DNA_END=1497 /DNA_ORIENTATION=+
MENPDHDPTSAPAIRNATNEPFVAQYDSRYEPARAILAKRKPLDVRAKRALLSEIRNIPTNTIGAKDNDNDNCNDNDNDGYSAASYVFRSKIRELFTDLNQSGSKKQQGSRWNASYAASVLASFYVCMEAWKDAESITAVKDANVDANANVDVDADNADADDPADDDALIAANDRNARAAAAAAAAAAHRAALESIASRIREAVAAKSLSQPHHRSHTCGDANGIANPPPGTAIATPTRDSVRARLRDLGRDFDRLSDRETELLDLWRGLRNDADALQRALNNTNENENEKNLQITPHGAVDPVRAAESVLTAKPQDTPKLAHANAATGPQTNRGTKADAPDSSHDNNNNNNNKNNNKEAEDEEDAIVSSSGARVRRIQKRKLVPVARREHPTREQRLLARKNLEAALFADDDDDSDDSD